MWPDGLAAVYAPLPTPHVQGISSDRPALALPSQTIGPGRTDSETYVTDVFPTTCLLIVQHVISGSHFPQRSGAPFGSRRLGWTVRPPPPPRVCLRDQAVRPRSPSRLAPPCRASHPNSLCTEAAGPLLWFWPQGHCLVSPVEGGRAPGRPYLPRSQLPAGRLCLR